MFVAIAARRDSASFRKACRERRLASGGQAGMPEPGPVRLRTNVQPDLPPISLDHLAALSDDTGIFQHAVHALADRSHGYCIDDNARALLLCCGLAGGPDAPLARRLSSTFAAFIQHGWNPRSEEHTSELQSLMRTS